MGAEVGELAPSVERALVAEITPLTDERIRLYELPDLRATSEHEWGWVVGLNGFLEYVAIADHGRRVILLVASDD